MKSTYLSLFLSSSTLLCCALPSALVLLGMGSVFASIMSVAPWLATVSHYKIEISVLTAVMLVIAGWMLHRQKHQACPLDDGLAQACEQTRKRATIIYSVSCVIFIGSSFFTYILPRFVL